MSIARFVGKTYGNYRIEAPLDAGSMGYVYSGKHIYLDQEVAIKIMRERADYAVYRSRFLEETRSAAGIKNVNVVEIYEFGEQDEQLFIVMELVPDGSLRTLLQQRERKPWPLSPGIDLIRQAAEGLAAAHAQRIVHSDIKPENLLLKRIHPEEEGEAEYQVKISDFGLARIAGGNAVTAIGLPTGTYSYMSPEQAKGIAIDGRSDIYSLGVVLYEVATGYLPFQISTFDDALRKHVEVEPTPPSQVRSTVTPELEAIILRCLAKKPEDRYQTGTALALALQSLRFESRKKPREKAPPVQEPPEEKVPPRRIDLRLEPTNLTIVPGQPATIRLQIANPGPRTDRLALSMAGVPLEWVGLPNEIRLNPGQKETISLIVNVPMSPNNLAKDYTVTVLAQSLQQAAEPGSARALWKVQPFRDEVLLINPPSITARSEARYIVSVDNRSNIEVQHSLIGTDSNGKLAYQFNPPVFSLRPGQRADIPLLVQSSSRFVGGKQPQPFQVYSRRTTDNPPLAASAEFVQTALLSPALATIMSIVLACVIVLGAGFIFFTHNSSSDTIVVANVNLQVQANTPNTIRAAFVSNLSIADFKVVANIVSRGDGGGLIFRRNGNGSQGYRFLIGNNGTFNLASQRGTLSQGSSNAIRRGSGSTNQVVVEAQGSHIIITVNSQTLINIQDNSANTGSIGLLAIDLQQPTVATCLITVSRL